MRLWKCQRALDLIADKGSQVVVMNIEGYFQLAILHLSDERTYEILSGDLILSLVRAINDYVDKALEKHAIDGVTSDYLRRDPTNVRTKHKLFTKNS